MPGALAQPSLKLSCTGGVWDACPPVTISPSLLCPPVLQRLGDAHQAPLRQRLRRLRPADLRGRQRGGDHREHVPPLLQPRVSFCSGPAPCPCPPPSTQGRVSGTPGGAKGSSWRGRFGSNRQHPFFGRALALCAWSSSCQPPLPHNSSGSAACGASSALAAEGGEVSCKSGSAASSQSPGRGQVRGFFPSCDSAVELGCSLLLTP